MTDKARSDSASSFLAFHGRFAPGEIAGKPDAVNEDAVRFGFFDGDESMGAVAFAGQRLKFEGFQAQV